MSHALTLALLSGLFCGVPALLFFAWALCRAAAAGTQSVPDGNEEWL